jgi:uncharacterized protein (TIGR04552 family)
VSSSHSVHTTSTSRVGSDLPLRIERLLPEARSLPDLAHVIFVFVLAEFQIADKATALQNESGASRHEVYKARQHERVRLHLFRDKGTTRCRRTERIDAHRICARFSSAIRRSLR